MKTRLLKEARELLPYWAGTLLLVLAPFAMSADRAAHLASLALGFGCAVLGGVSFGHELQHGTLPLFLSQPVARAVLWREKMLVLAAALVTASALFIAIALPHLATLVTGPASFHTAAFLLLPLAAFCSAPCFTLLARSGLAGAVVSATFPGFLMWGAAAADWLVAVVVGPVPSLRLYLLCALMIIYCGLLHRRGYAAFVRLEVSGAASRELRMPEWLEASVSRRLGVLSARLAGPFASLLKKELRLQQVVFVLAGVQYLAAVLLAAGLHQAEVKGWGKVVVILSGSYFGLIPLLAGAVAVAEERGWGISEWHLSLPPSALKQWLAKVLVGLSVSLVLGLLVPVALLLAGRQAFAVSTEATDAVASLPALLGILTLAHLVLTSVIIYAATLSASTLRAILLGLGIAVGLVLFHAAAVGVLASLDLASFGAARSASGGRPNLGIAAVELLVLLGVVQQFAFANYRRHGVPARTIGLQGLSLGALVFAFAGLMQVS